MQIESTAINDQLERIYSAVSTSLNPIIFHILSSGKKPDDGIETIDFKQFSHPGNCWTSTLLNKASLPASLLLIEDIKWTLARLRFK